MTNKIVVLTTCGSADEAVALARQLVELRLAACVNVLGGVRSFYRWKGALEEAAEWLLVIKSRRDLFEQLRAELAARHSYEVPELLALPVSEGSPDYVNWMDGELAPEAG
ncbi:MAG: divalent-cation tolerance protein CutA [Bryobacterales bacterium]|nr:divalent-cation tolerance protein CutA [Bryobacterales bacterium]